MPDNKLTNLAGRVASNIAGRLFALYEQEITRANSYRELLEQLKAGQVSPGDLAVTPDPPPINTAQLIVELLGPMITGHFVLIEEESQRAHQYYQMVGQIARGEVDPSSLVITDDGITTVPPLEDELEPSAVPQTNGHSSKQKRSRKTDASDTPGPDPQDTVQPAGDAGPAL